MVVKSATKKKLIDLGVPENFAHALANDRKWDEVKVLNAQDIAQVCETDSDQAAKILARLDLDSQTLLYSKMDEATAEALKSRVSLISPESIEEEDESVARTDETQTFDFAQINDAIQSVNKDIKSSEEKAKNERDKMEKAGLSWRGVGW